jgi:hypothetical protein
MQSAPGSTTSLAGVYFAMGSSGQRPRSLSLLSAFRGNSFGYGDLTTHRGPSDHREVSRGVRHARRGPSDPRSLLRSPEDALGPTEPRVRQLAAEADKIAKARGIGHLRGPRRKLAIILPGRRGLGRPTRWRTSSRRSSLNPLEPCRRWPSSSMRYCGYF